MGDEIKNIDIVMLSKFDKNDGGRETWLYNFLPELLKDSAIGKIKLFGYKKTSEKDFSVDLISLDRFRKNKVSVTPIIFNGYPSKLPQGFTMFKLLKNYKEKSVPISDITLAMGFFNL